MTRPDFRLSRRHLIGLIGATALSSGAVWGDTLASMRGTAFGTSWRIVGPSGSPLERMRARIEALFADIDRKMSPWRPDSSIGRFNASQAGIHAAEPDLVEVAAQALTLAEKSKGAFDPTVGPLVSRWGFGPIEGGTPDWRAVSIDGNRILKERNDLTLDLCGIAKGWALDRTAEIAQAEGHNNLLLDLGGEYIAIGWHPSGRSWQIAVEHPVPGHPAPAVLRLPAGHSVATSGSRTQSYRIGDQTYGHIIDPATQTPATGALQSVTVLAADAMTADGWATALFAAGETHGPSLAETQGIGALFLIQNGPALRQIRTGAIEEAVL